MTAETLDKPKSRSCLGLDLTRKQWALLACLCTVSVASGICVSLQGPIYPPEAERRGATATEYGMVFGVFELMAFIICPIYGKYMDKMGARNVLVFGMAVGGISMVLFGLLDLIEDHLPFITLSFLFRILESVGSSAAFTASFSIVAMLFTGKVATIYAIMECFYGLGFSLGPTIGGYLYEVGGFIAPFVLVGVSMLADSVVLYCAVPIIRREKDTEKQKVGILSVLKLPSSLLDYISIIVANICIGFNMATLEPHLRQFTLGKAGSGAVFAIMATFYMLSAPVVGRLCDTRVNPKAMLIAGSLLSVLGFALVGPLPFLHVQASLWMVILGLAITGMGLSCLMVPAFIDAVKSAVKGGLPDHINTYSVVSGLSTSSVYLGAFVGPSIAGVLFDTVGFRWSTLFVIAVNILLLFAMVTFVIKRKFCTYKPAQDTSSPEKLQSVEEGCDNPVVNIDDVDSPTR